MKNWYNKNNKEGIFIMSKYSTTPKLHTGKTTYKSKFGRHYILRVSESVPAEKYYVNEEPKAIVVQTTSPLESVEVKKRQGLIVRISGRVGSPRINTGRKVVTGKSHNTRTGPAGKKAMISDGAVDSISENMEKRTRKAIAKIGRSIGF